MRGWAAGCAAAVLLAATAGLAAQTAAKGEERLARVLEGRVAGEPVDCIFATNLPFLKVISKTAITYKSGDILYVNRPYNAEKLDSSNVLILDRRGGRLCAGDVIGSIAPVMGAVRTGSFVLGPFVPYRKAEPQG